MEAHVHDASLLREALAARIEYVNYFFAPRIRSAQLIVWEEAAFEAFQESLLETRPRETHRIIVDPEAGLVQQGETVLGPRLHWKPDGFPCLGLFHSRPEEDLWPDLDLHTPCYVFVPGTNFESRPGWMIVTWPEWLSEGDGEKACAELMAAHGLSREQAVERIKQSRYYPESRRPHIRSFSFSAGSDITEKATIAVLQMEVMALEFIEQSYVDCKRRFIDRAPNARSGPGRKIQEEVVTVHLRKAVYEKMTRPAPEASAEPKWRLDHEVAVRGHIRHFRNGTQTQVRSHTRGPKGVRKERVIHVTR